MDEEIKLTNPINHAENVDVRIIEEHTGAGDVSSVTTNQENDAEIPSLYGKFQGLDLVDERDLARIFNCHRITIKRAVHRGELPRPIKMFGRSTWTVNAILRHVDARLKQAAEDQENLEKNLFKHGNQ